MDQLKEERNVIRKVDAELVRLFEERMHAVSRIASYKKENHLPVFDPAREAENTGRVLGLLEDESLKAYFLEWYQMTMDISKAYQETILTEES